MNEPQHDRIVAVSIGNTRTRFGVFEGDDAVSTRLETNSDGAALVDAIAAAAREVEEAPGGAVVIASVNARVADPLAAALAERTSAPVLRLGVDLAIPIAHTLGERHTTGQDRLLAALAAFRLARQACVVVDAGTAVTIDFVDGEGTFHGGAIAPGAAMMLRALREQTAQLPEVPFERPDPETFGKSTREAMLNGVFFGIRGAVRALAERYAERYGAYPRIIATGGDAETLFEGDEFIEQIVPDLVLQGVALSMTAARRLAAAEGPDDEA
ncbi:MAG: type III pantothenate kinase [Phycisphaerales bacterium]